MNEPLLKIKCLSKYFVNCLNRYINIIEVNNFIETKLENFNQIMTAWKLCSFVERKHEISRSNSDMLKKARNIQKQERYVQKQSEKGVDRNDHTNIAMHTIKTIAQKCLKNNKSLNNRLLAIW